MKAIKKAVLHSIKRDSSELRFFVRKYFNLQKGEFVLIKTPKGNNAIIACPKCGTQRSLGKHTIEVKNGGWTVKPSINNNDGGCCDYHGHLKNSVFTGNL